jgi:predicted dehydrogenase
MQPNYNMPKEKTWNWGILGPGKIAHKFVQDLQAHVPNARVHAVASRSIERAEAFAAQYQVPNSYGSYQELLACPHLDIIYIATPHSQHYQNTLMCLHAGIPTLCEKAFAVNSKQLQEMVLLAQSKKVFLQEAIWTRFHPATKQVLEWIEQDKIGQIVHIAADFGFKADLHPEGRLLNKQLTGGSLMDIGIYPLFISQLLLGQPSALKAVGTFSETEVDLSCSMALQYANGATANLYSTILANTTCEAHIYGSKGKIKMHNRFHETKGITLEQEGKEPITLETERLGHGYSYEIADVQRCLAQGLTENNLLPLQFSQELMALLDTVKKQIGLVYLEDLI